MNASTSQEIAIRPKRNQNGANNPCWKGGISKNHYHYKKLQRQRYPERVNAREKVHRAVKSGRLQKLPCWICAEPKTFAHHRDYSKPLEVVWLCRKHHHDLHNKKIEVDFATPTAFSIPITKA